MKKTVLLAAFICIPAAGLRAGDGCDRSSDACKTRIKKVTPFLAELKKAQTSLALNQGPAKTPSSFAPALLPGASKGRGSAALSLSEAAPSLGQGGPKARPAVSTAPAAAAPAAPPEGEKTVSHPAWLLVGAGLLAGLHYFLKENKKKRRG